MRFSSIFLLLLITGCAQFESSRSFLSEMEHDDSSFFEPGGDFQVLAGDSGRKWMSDRSRRERTPTSSMDIEERQERSVLQNELRSLEAAQSEHSLDQYEKVRHRFANTSEKIYYLKLSPYERQDYLESKGFSTRSPAASPKLNQRSGALRQKEVFLGMSKEDIVDNLGRPKRVEVAGNPRNENERWVYSHNGATKYIYFEAGKVEGWE